MARSGTGVTHYSSWAATAARLACCKHKSKIMRSSCLTHGLCGRHCARCQWPAACSLHLVRRRRSKCISGTAQCRCHRRLPGTAGHSHHCCCWNSTTSTHLLVQVSIPQVVDGAAGAAQQHSTRAKQCLRQGVGSNKDMEFNGLQSTCTMFACRRMRCTGQAHYGTYNPSTLPHTQPSPVGAGQGGSQREPPR